MLTSLTQFIRRLTHSHKRGVQLHHPLHHPLHHEHGPHQLVFPMFTVIYSLTASSITAGFKPSLSLFYCLPLLVLSYNIPIYLSLSH